MTYQEELIKLYHTEEIRQITVFKLENKIHIVTLDRCYNLRALDRFSELYPITYKRMTYNIRNTIRSIFVKDELDKIERGVQ